MPLNDIIFTPTATGGGGGVDQVSHWGEMRKKNKERGIFQKSETCPTSPPGFNPDLIYYDAPRGHYLIDTGEIYRDYSRKSPVTNGVIQFLRATQKELKEKELPVEAKECLDKVEIERAVDWCGSIAGYQRGMRIWKGSNFLVLDGPNLIESASTASPVLDGIIDGVFPDEEAKAVFLAWVKTGVEAIRSSTHCPAPMLVLAGGVNSGKSLLAWVVQQCFGGRVAHPMTAWSGDLVWNDNLLGAELLLLDDCASSSDMRARKTFGARFKEAIYGSEIEVRKRNTSSISLRPVWRVMVCCNEEPDNLAVIPPLDDDMEDKIILLKTEKVSLPIDTSTPDGKTELQKILRDELPGFLHRLDKLEVPDQLKDSRSGIRAWKDPRLIAALRDISHHGRLENLLSVAIKDDQFEDLTSPGCETWLTAAAVQAALSREGSPTRYQARSLLSYDAAAGSLLSKLLKQGSHYVIDGKTVNGTKQYKICYPDA